MDTGSKPKLKDINKYVKPSAIDRWYDIGLELEVGDENGIFLDDIKKPWKSNEDCFMEMIKEWVRSDSPDVTWRTLLSCLRELEIEKAVKCIESKLQMTSQAVGSHAPTDMATSQFLSESRDIRPGESPSAHSPLLVLRYPAEAIANHSQEGSEQASERTVQQIPVSVDPPEIAFSPEHQMHIDQVSAAEMSTLSPVNCSDSPQPIDYSLQLPSGHEIRKYQHELAEPGIRGDNYIFVAPTGSGKTLIAAIVICEHLNKVQALGEVPKVVFMVTTKPLAEQQRVGLERYIKGARVGCVVGESSVSIKSMLGTCEIVVCTTGKLLDELDRGWMSLTSPCLDEDKSSVSLLVMDECHHTRKSSAQAQLMHRYLKQKQASLQVESRLPQVVGLTASPGAGDSHSLEFKKTIDHLIELCALMDATSGIVTVRKNMEELERFTTNPLLLQEILNCRNPTEDFILLVENEMAKLESFTKMKCPFPKWSQQYETKASQIKLPFELSTNEAFRDQISALKLLICYCQALNIYMDLRKEDALKFLEDYTDLPASDEICTPCEIDLKKGLRHLILNLKALPCVENPLLEKAAETIFERFEKAPYSRGVFFVRTKRIARAVCEWINSLAVFLKAEVITGHSGRSDRGMTQADQAVAMEAFRSGESNILVATSVAEEGLDVPACNFVIRFQHVSNEIAKAQTQGRARAEDSECITIMSSESKLSMREIRNTERLELVNKVIKNNWFPRGDILRAKLEEQQKSIIQNLKYKQLFKQHQKSAQRDKIKFLCRKCNTVACFGSDVFTAERSTHYVVPNKDILEKVVIKPHPKPGKIDETISKTHKIFCKKCNADWPWGVMGVWLKEGFKFPVLKCGSFVLQEGEGAPFLVQKWSKAPFQPLPLEAWIAGQNYDDSDDDDDDDETS